MSHLIGGSYHKAFYNNPGRNTFRNYKPAWKQTGINWIDLGRFGSETEISSLLCIKDGIILAGSLGTAHIYRSINYGKTWTDLGAMFGEGVVNGLTYCGNGIVIAGTSNLAKIIRSTDYGAT